MKVYRVLWRLPRGLFQDPAPGRYFSRSEARDFAWRFMEMGVTLDTPCWVTIILRNRNEADVQAYSCDYGDYEIQEMIEREAKRKEEVNGA